MTNARLERHFLAYGLADLGLAVLLLSLGHCSRLPPPRTSLDAAPPRIVSAFFGLDHAMPEGARGLCWSAPGQDGLPVTFSRRVTGKLDPRAFTVRTRSGTMLHPTCATTSPANGPAKNHTVLLIGELGREPEDPPVSVEVTGSVPLEGADARGLSASVTELAAGPTLVLAFSVRGGQIASDCPAETRQIVVAIWAGGIRTGPSIGEASHLAGYRLTTLQGETVPFALGDLDDRDNYVHLCLATEANVEKVSFPAGIVVDPRGDPNPATSVLVAPSLTPTSLP